MLLLFSYSMTLHSLSFDSQYIVQVSTVSGNITAPSSALKISIPQGN